MSRLLNVLLTLAIIVTTSVDANGQLLKSVDVFGSEQVAAEDIRDNWGADIEELVSLLKNLDRAGFEAKRQELVDVIGQSGIYSFVDISVYEQFLPEYGAYVTVDLVDPVDVGERLQYDAPPGGSPRDPDSLVSTWLEYDATARVIRDREGAPSNSCNAFHCIWGYNHPDLAPYGDIFKRSIVQNEQGLADVLHDHKDPDKREAALFLLAHGRSQKGLLAHVESALTDADPAVRAAALEILASISDNRPDLVPIDAVLPALLAPTTRERAAALQVLSNVSGPIANRERILVRGGHALIRMLSLDQPSNNSPAYELLKKVSGRHDLSQYDHASWTELVDQTVAMAAEAESAADADY